jgi:hypothetical protein
MKQLTVPTLRGVDRGIAATGALLALALAGALHASTAGAARTPSAPIIAGAARTISVNDNGELKRTHASGDIIDEAGKISGTLPGTATVRLNVGPETITASFTIEVHGGGSIVGAGRAKIGSDNRYTSFAGTLSVTGGTGRYAHARGEGKLYGTIERVSDRLTVQTRKGTLHY